MRRLALILALLATAAAPAKLTDEAIRSFVQRQERAWNAEDARAYFALFTADALFVDQARTSKGGILPYGKSDLATAKTQSRRYFARARFVERGVVEKIVIAADGRSAQVLTGKVTQVESAGRSQKLCAQSQQTLVLVRGAIRSRGQTDTATRCRDATAPRP